MKFRQAVANTPDIANAYYPGLQAIPSGDSARMSCSNSRKVAGSICLDEAVKKLYPNASRWDYGIGLEENQNSDRVIWVEVHPASTHNVKELVSKLNWLKNWLENSAPQIKALGRSHFHWIASGKIAILKNSPQARSLAQSGIQFPTKHLSLDTVWAGGFRRRRR